MDLAKSDVLLLFAGLTTSGILAVPSSLEIIPDLPFPYCMRCDASETWNGIHSSTIYAPFLCRTD